MTSLPNHDHVVGSISGAVSAARTGGPRHAAHTEDARRGVSATLVSDLARRTPAPRARRTLQIARTARGVPGTYDLFLDRFNLGVASRLETSRALGALGNAQATIPQLQSAIVARENQISILLGKAPGPIPRGEPMYAQPVAPTVPAGLPSALLERRPDLREAEQQLVAANARIGMAKAEFFPKLSLTALFGAASPELSSLTGGGATVWAVAGMLSGPLLNAGRTTGQYRASIAQWEQVRLVRTTVLGALQRLDALTALRKLIETETGQTTAARGLETPSCARRIDTARPGQLLRGARASSSSIRRRRRSRRSAAIG
jgi:multidrug efflux system outer membrane protein